MIALFALAPALAEDGSTLALDAASHTTMSLRKCPADLDLSAPHTSLAQVRQGQLLRWKEYDTAGETCVLQVKPELELLSPEEARQLFGTAQANAASSIDAPSSVATTSLPKASRAEKPRLDNTSLDRESLASRAAAAFRRRAKVVRRGKPAARSTADKDFASAGALSAPIVFGKDDRIRVLNTTQLPFNTVVYVESEFPNGQVLAQSGVLIGPYTVLTAASALYQDSLGGWASLVEVAPGQTQTADGANLNRPYGSQLDYDIAVTQDWIDTQDASFMYGAVFLEQAFAGIDSFMSVVFNAAPKDLVNIAGYDESLSGASYAQWTRNGVLFATDGTYFDHRMDDDAGAVGAPAWEYLPISNNRRIFGLNCCVDNSINTNVGVRFTSANEDVITEWMAFEPPQGPDPGLDPEPLTIGGKGGAQFDVTVTWRDANGNQGVGHPWALTPDTGYFDFFDPDNVELVVKVLDACSFNDRFWVFAGGLTNVEVEIVVTDRLSGVERVYRNPLGESFLPIQDTDAFATCP